MREEVWGQENVEAWTRFRSYLKKFLEATSRTSCLHASELLDSRVVFKPIKVSVIGAGLTVTAGVHGEICANKTASNGRTENASVNVFSECVPLPVR